MSAFLCTPKHVFAVALYSIRRDGLQSVKTEQLINLAKKLRRLNNYALRMRYGDSAKPLPRDPFPSIAAANEWLDSASKADILGIVECFKYQCSEGDCEARQEWPLILDIHASARIDARGAGSAVWSI